jgi:hypothetical protein
MVDDIDGVLSSYEENRLPDRNQTTIYFSLPHHTRYPSSGNNDEKCSSSQVEDVGSQESPKGYNYGCILKSK